MTNDEIGTHALDDRVEAVVIGHTDSFSYRELAIATQYLRTRDVELVGTNPDAADRLPGTSWMPGTGALLAAVEVASGTKAYVVGKGGGGFLVEYLANIVPDGKRALMVGDRIDTDVELGLRAGFRTLLVLSGACSESDLPAIGGPEFVSPVVTDLRENM
eukprot:gnl/TRDRNA2_/TRDRNA2_159628_c0_seq1.p2 gnl/TRDRNA2_/TRDRNA2_159628_c0~~gnl/TRDRNA2_/TRDRNA2_159628_c0_seq1.p2  ORF type:complete len:160 (-),score=27.74 gnl/TRDRNA2_/TRDRNA2_159628_c0_seq1:50-529(-)